MGYFLFALLILSMASANYGSVRVNYIYNWTHVDFDWKNQKQMEDAKKSGIYDPHKCVIIDGTRAKDGRVFVTVPREFGFFSPATLATVTNKTGPGGPILRPYPEWSWHNNDTCTCNGITNAYRVQIQCNHIFVLDNGKIGLNQTCNPKLLIFDLKDDKLVETIYIPLSIATNQTGFGALTVPYVYIKNGNCTQFLDKIIIIMADVRGNGLVVYDSSTKRICRVESDYMKPTDTLVTIGNVTFPYANGPFSVTVLNDDVYYASIQKKEIYKIKIKTLLECPNKENANKENKLVIKLPSHTGHIASAGNSIFYCDNQAIAILGTNVKKAGKNTVMLAQDFEKLQGIPSMKVSNYWNRIMIVSNRYHLFAIGKTNINETNFRYFEMDLSKIQKLMN
ncbi:PREDICTED: major royal jelly protein 3-like [Wasmannia auropunctata]|uniref:major royal jelly protein 3-like n=1 Tax=Wasmannia auropunctata TaxID=64793 RepID=UPI0005EDAEA2|nr:PREDICTED: major royal jelly protein 3-like [Wasmannia auropunctata]XP_011694547.1 PREDICTED: major royal jelly protein 3-like [Wasmannia auropunctata]